MYACQASRRFDKSHLCILHEIATSLRSSRQAWRRRHRRTEDGAIAYAMQTVGCWSIDRETEDRRHDPLLLAMGLNPGQKSKIEDTTPLELGPIRA